MLAFSPALAPLGGIAVQHHERLDGSGYPAALSGEQIETTAGGCWRRPTCYHAMTRAAPAPAGSRRAGRGGGVARARSPPDDSTATRWTACCVRRGTGSVAGASGRPGLTTREVEVLQAAGAGAVEQTDRRSSS